MDNSLLQEYSLYILYIIIYFIPLYSYLVNVVHLIHYLSNLIMVSYTTMLYSYSIPPTLITPMSILFLVCPPLNYTNPSIYLLMALNIYLYHINIHIYSLQTTSLYNIYSYPPTHIHYYTPQETTTTTITMLLTYLLLYSIPIYIYL